MLPYIAKGFRLFPASRVPQHSKRAKGCQIRAKRGENELFFGVLWCFLGVLGDHKGQNTNIFLKTREENGLKCGRLACLLACPLEAGGRTNLAILLTLAR